jgi:hypothetical protein
VNANPLPAWGLARPYQPTSRHFDLQMISITNPIWVDADGDGKFTCAREYARQLVEKYHVLPELFAELATYDYYVAAHCGELLAARGQNLATSEITALIAKAPAEIERGFREYLATTAQ